MTQAKITRFKVFLISLLLVLLPSLCLAQETYIWTDKGMKHIEPEKENQSNRGAPAPDKYLHQGSDKDAEELEEQQRAEKIENARREYEEAKKSEREYRIRNNYTGNRRTRYLWKQSLQRLETAKQHLEELEKTQ